MKTHNLFPTQVWEIEHDVPKDIVDYVLNVKETKKSVSLSNRAGSWHSLCSLHKEEEFCSRYLNDLLNKVRELDFLPEFKVTACWFNVNGRGALNLPHTHPGCDLSLVWYIKTPENSGELEIENPFLFPRINLIDYFPLEFNEEHDIVEYKPLPPAEGRCYIFPPDLRHSVSESNSDELRISFSANLKFVDYNF